MPEKPLMGKKTIVELGFVFALIALCIIIVASIRFAVFSSLSGYGAGAVFPVLVAAILLFFAALVHFKPFEKRYLYMFIAATLLMLAAYCIANLKCAFWEQILCKGAPACESSTVFWLMLIAMMLSVFSAIICALDFFRERHREIEKKLE